MMDLEQPSGDSAAVDTAPPVETGLPGDQSDLLLDGDLPEPQTPPVDDDEDDEIDGVKLRGKKDALERFKSERLMQADYTRKTQEVADQRKTFEGEQARFQEIAKHHQENVREISHLVAIDDRLKQFANVNWDALTDQDATQALKLHTEFAQLQARKGQIEQSLTQKQQQRDHDQQRESAKQIMEARQVLARDIKGWSPDLANTLTDYGRAQGFPAQVLDNVTQPTFIKALHKAYLYDELLKQQKTKAPATPVPPVTRVGGAGVAATKRLSEMSDADYSAARQKYKQTHHG